MMGTLQGVEAEVVVGPKDIQGQSLVLVVTVTLYVNWYIENVIKLYILRWGDYHGTFKWDLNVILRVLRRGNEEEV